MQHAIAVSREKEGGEKEGGLPTGKFKRATLVASQMPKTGRHKLELELGHELDWLAQCVRGDLSTVAAGAKWCKKRRLYVYIVWHAAFAYFVGGRTGSHLSIGSKRCHKGARQRKQSKADTYVNQTRLPPPLLATRPRAPLAPSPSAAPSPVRLPNLHLFKSGECGAGSAGQKLLQFSCRNQLQAHSHTHSYTHLHTQLYPHSHTLGHLTH